MFFCFEFNKYSHKSSYFINTLQVIYNQTDKERIAIKKEKTKAGKQRIKVGGTPHGKNLPKGRPQKDTQPKESITKQEYKNSTASFRVFAECRPKALRVA